MPDFPTYHRPPLPGIPDPLDPHCVGLPWTVLTEPTDQLVAFYLDVPSTAPDPNVLVPVVLVIAPFGVQSAKRKSK